MNPRRTFLRQLALTATGVALQPNLAALARTGDESLRTPAAAPSTELSYATFLRHQGTEFQVWDAEGQMQSLRLEKVTRSALRGNLEGFTVQFRGAGAHTIAENSCRFLHPELKEFSLFIQPGAQTETHCFYRAVFCRLG